MDRATGRLPDATAEASGEFDLGDDDIIADGGTQIMAREPAFAEGAPPTSEAPPVPKAPSSLDTLAATIPVKNTESKFAAPTKVVPPAPKTEPIHELDSDDLEEEEQRRIERTQPFDRSRLFGAPRPGDGLPAAAPAAAAPAAAAPVAATPAPAQPQPTLLAATQPVQPAPRAPQATQPPMQATQPSMQATQPSMQATPPRSTQVSAAPRVQTPSAAWRPAPVPRLDLVVSPTPPPVSVRPSAHVPVHLPSVVINDAPPPQHRPASIAPLAIDVAPARAIPDATLKLPAVRHVPAVPKSNTPVIAGAIAGGVALCAAAVIALVSFTGTGSSESSSNSTPTVAAKPREAQKGAVHSAVIETPETTPQKAEAKAGEPDEDGTPVYSPSSLPSAPALRESSGSSSHASAPSIAQAAPSTRATTTTTTTTTPRSVKSAAPAQPAPVEPAPPPVAAAPPPPARPAAPPPTTGTIEVPGSLMTVMVDGDYKRVQGGRIVVTCGKHRVNAGRGTQVVDVPCGGVASVM